MDKAVVLLGGHYLNRGVYEKFHRRGRRVLVVDWNERPAVAGDRHYCLDVKDAEAVLDVLRRDNWLPKVEMVYTSIDRAVPTMIAVHRAMGLLTPPPEVAPCAISKSAMTARWRETGLLNRWSRGFKSFAEEIVERNRAMALIIKPDNSASSRGITIMPKGSPRDDLARAFGVALDESSNAAAVVEEFLDGQEFDLQMLGDSRGNVAVYSVGAKSHSAHARTNKVAVKNHYNALEFDAAQGRVAEYAARCYKALGAHTSMCDFEIILKRDGTLSPVEMGIRGSGFIASDLSDIVTGRDYFDDWIGVLHGGAVANGLMPQTGESSVYFFYDFPPGAAIKREASLMDFLDTSVTSRYHDRRALARGRTFAPMADDTSRPGYEILQGPKALLTRAYLAEKEREFLEYVTH